jgi:hypothetical protein
MPPLLRRTCKRGLAPFPKQGRTRHCSRLPTALAALPLSAAADARRSVLEKHIPGIRE